MYYWILDKDKNPLDFVSVYSNIEACMWAEYLLRDAVDKDYYLVAVD